MIRITPTNKIQAKDAISNLPHILQNILHISNIPGSLFIIHCFANSLVDKCQFLWKSLQAGYYAYRLSMQQGKFRTHVLLLQLCCCHG